MRDTHRQNAKKWWLIQELNPRRKYYGVAKIQLGNHGWRIIFGQMMLENGGEYRRIS